MACFPVAAFWGDERPEPVGGFGSPEAIQWLFCIKDHFVDLYVVLDHAFGREMLLNMAAAVDAINPWNAGDRIDGFVHGID